MKSILQDKKECFVCKSPYVEEHHVIYGSGYRKKSERYGLKVWLCPEHHRGNSGVHGGNKELDLKLKRLAQETLENFFDIFGRYY